MKLTSNLSNKKILFRVNSAFGLRVRFIKNKDLISQSTSFGLLIALLGFPLLENERSMKIEQTCPFIVVQVVLLCDPSDLAESHWTCPESHGTSSSLSCSGWSRLWLDLIRSLSKSSRPSRLGLGLVLQPKFPWLFCCAGNRFANVSSYIDRAGGIEVWSPIEKEFLWGRGKSASFHVSCFEGVYILKEGKDRRMWMATPDRWFFVSSFFRVLVQMHTCHISLSFSLHIKAPRNVPCYG